MAYEHVEEQCAFGPRLVGTEASRQAADYVSAQLRKNGWSVVLQDFSYRGVALQNVVGKRGRGPLVILGAHYDTRALADLDPVDPKQPVLGANDGASGVAVLLELARVLDQQRVDCEVWLVFFDAEDQGGINGWPFSVGAAYMADSLQVPPEAVVVVDMVGDSDQDLYWEGNSDRELTRALWGIADELGYRQYFIPQQKHTVIDDHVPFAVKGWVAVDIIDFDYRYWHTGEDTPDKVSASSLERVGRVLEVWLERGGCGVSAGAEPGAADSQ
jgi:Zn-dependent M28 family amino/carboxypeptidase